MGASEDEKLLEAAKSGDVAAAREALHEGADVECIVRLVRLLLLLPYSAAFAIGAGADAAPGLRRGARRRCTWRRVATTRPW